MRNFWNTFETLCFFSLHDCNLCPDSFGHVGNGLIKKLKLISKFMTSKTWQQIIAMHTGY